MGKIKQLVRFDWFIKNLLRDKADFEILEGFLSELLKDDITIIEIVESEGNKKNKLDKFNRVDVLVKTSNDERAEYYLESLRSEASYQEQLKFEASKMVDEMLNEKIMAAYRKGNSIATIANFFEFSIEKISEIIKNNNV